MRQRYGVTFNCLLSWRFFEYEVSRGLEGKLKLEDDDNKSVIEIEIRNHTLPRIIPTDLRVNYTYSVVSMKWMKNQTLVIFWLLTGYVPTEFGVFPHHSIICTHPPQSLDLCQGEAHKTLICCLLNIVFQVRRSRIKCSAVSHKRRRDLTMAVALLIIVLIFIICHSFKFVINLVEFLDMYLSTFKTFDMFLTFA